MERNVGKGHRLAVFASGNGSNFEAILERSRAERWAETIGADIRAVISNRPEAKGLVTARNNGIEAVALDHKTFASREEFDKALGDLVASYEPDLVVLAGFMRVLTPVFTDRFEGRMLNIHPALLPLFPGLHTHERAIEAGCRVHGSTVHFVSSVLDGGAIIGQAVVPVLASDDADTLAHRGLRLEHILYPRAVKAVASGKVKLVDGRTVTDDETAKSLAVFDCCA